MKWTHIIFGNKKMDTSIQNMHSKKWKHGGNEQLIKHLSAYYIIYIY